MKKSILLSVTTFALFLLSTAGFSQTLELGALSSFEAYTGTGAVSMAAAATLTGDVGSNVGAISGFVPPAFTGTLHHANSVTAQCRIDLLKLYIDLSNLPVTHANTHAPAFGVETITPGVYYIGGAGSLTGALTLDGNNDPDASFVIKFNGAMTVEAGAQVILTNGTQACNVFWIAEGAITAGAGSILKGTLFSHFAAVGLGANCNLEGRMLSMEGAITIGAGSSAIASGCVSTIQIPCFPSAPAVAVDVLGSLENFTLFTSAGAVGNTGASGVFGNIGTNAGAINGFAFAAHVGAAYNSDVVTAQAKIDLDNAYTQLLALPNTSTTHTPAFGLGETLSAGVYSIAGAGSLAGTLTLDGNNNSDAVFVFKFGGAFTVGAQSKIILINGARPSNVFWIGGAGVPTGAISIAAGSHLKGTFISHAGACNLGAGAILDGRLLSTAGAVNTNVSIAHLMVHDEICYCESEGSTTGFEWIKKVRLKSIKNKSGNDNGYGDYTHLGTNLNPGQNKNIKLKPRFGNNGADEKFWRVWVDWNNDGDFDDSGELEVEHSSFGNVTQQITVPTNAPAGNKMMRVSMKSGAYSSPCETFLNGEVEDYTIFITGSNPPTPRLADPGNSSVANPLNVSVYPNPSNGVFNLNFTNIDAKTNIFLFDMTGRLMEQKSITSAEASQNILIGNNVLSSGAYVIRVISGEKSITKKVIVE
ncbi:MAG: hypothetical protein ACI9EQ_001282 [Bacteroidia bacterium]|jgi:hypothetical protein